MQRAIQLSQQALGWTDPNPAVGAVIFDSQGIWSEGWTQAPGESHAEIMALNNLSDSQRQRLHEASMAVTLEPCAHHGLTPPCADALVESRIGHVYIAIEDPNPVVAGRGIQRLKDAGIQVEIGLEANAAQWINRRFLTSITKKRPYIILKWAESPDGFIDRIRARHEPATAVTGRAIRSVVHQWRHEESAILIGHGTFTQDRPSLTVRDVYGTNPQRIVVSDAELDVEGWEQWRVPRDDWQHALPEAIKRSPYRSILVEGGAKIHRVLLEAGLWDEIRVLRGTISIGEGIAAPTLPPSTFQHRSLEVHGEIIDIYTHA